ncbi:hypothetical protein D3C72_1470870 [compost metagenome]
MLNITVIEPERLPPRQQYTSGRQPCGRSTKVVSRCRAMLRATIAAPMREASKGETWVYNVPTRTRSSSFSTGALMAPGMWSMAYSSGERTSMISSKSFSCSRSASRCFTFKAIVLSGH